MNVISLDLKRDTRQKSEKSQNENQYESYTSNIFTYYEYEFFQTMSLDSQTGQTANDQIDEKKLITSEYAGCDVYEYPLHKLGSYWPLQSAAMPLVR